MDKKTMIKEIAAKCRNEIQDYEVRVQLALKVINRDRCLFKTATPAFYNRVVDIAREWAVDNRIDVDVIDELDMEEVLLEW